MKPVKYEVLEPEEIRAEKVTVNWLIMQNLNRINYILSIGLAMAGESRLMSNVTASVRLSLRAIESLLVNDLDEKYYAEAEKLKKQLPTRLDSTIGVNNALMRWYDLIVRQLVKVNLVPAKQVVFDFED